MSLDMIHQGQPWNMSRFAKPAFPSMDSPEALQRDKSPNSSPKPAKSTIHLAIPRLRELNRRPTSGIADTDAILRKLTRDALLEVFRHAVEQDLFHTAFSSFSRPHPRCAPLSLRSLSRDCASDAESLTEVWASVSGAQHTWNSPHPKGIEAWIQRAGDLRPLNFHIAPPDWRYGQDGLPIDLGTDSNGQPRRIDDTMTPEILRIFMRQKYMKRWNHIAFEFDDALARVYLNGLSNSPFDPPGVRHLELVAVELTDNAEAQRVFQSIGRYAGSVRKLLWAGPPDMQWTNFGDPLTLKELKVLGLDVANIDQAVACLEKLDLPALEELKICFSGTTSASIFSEGPAGPRKLLEALKKTSTTPTVLWIHDDEFARTDHDAAIKQLVKDALMGNLEGIMKTVALRADDTPVSQIHFVQIGTKPLCAKRVNDFLNSNNNEPDDWYKVEDQDDGSVKICLH